MSFPKGQPYRSYIAHKNQIWFVILTKYTIIFEGFVRNGAFRITKVTFMEKCGSADLKNAKDFGECLIKRCGRWLGHFLVSFYLIQGGEELLAVFIIWSPCYASKILTNAGRCRCLCRRTWRRYICTRLYLDRLKAMLCKVRPCTRQKDPDVIHQAWFASIPILIRRLDTIWLLVRK